MKRLHKAAQSFSLAGFLYFLFLKLRRREPLVVGSCHGCGECCRNLSLHDGHGWLWRRNDFLHLVAEEPEFSRFEITETDAQGFLVFRCTLCSPEGLCKEYENRLPLCRNFPEKSLQFCGGKLPSGCGYSFQEVIPFAKVLKKELMLQKKGE